MWTLLSHDACPPGEFVYVQHYNGKAKKFGPSPLFAELAKRISNFRAANLLPRSSQIEAMEDIDAFTCQRLGNSPRWCHSTEKTFGEMVNVKAAGGCATCGKND